jgi:hypothetical protein
MKNITDTESFKIADSETGIIANISKLSQPEYVLDLEMLQQDLNWFERRYKEPLKNSVLDALSDKRIVPLFHKDLEAVPRLFPMWTMTGEFGVPVTYINLSHFAILKKDDDQLTISKGRLYGLLHAATILNSISSNSSIIEGNSKVLQNLAVVYSRLLGQVIDREYGLGAQPQTMDQVAYAIAKFFLIGMIGKDDDDRTANMAAAAITRGTTSFALASVDTHFAGSYYSLATFLKALVEFSPRIKDTLDTRLVLNRSTRWYSNLIWLALESPHYFVMNVLFVLNQAGLNNDARLEGIVGKEGGIAYLEMLKKVK